jgi:hypothetical protein
MSRNYIYNYWVIDESGVFGKYQSMKKAIGALRYFQKNGIGYLRPEDINLEIERVKISGDSMSFQVKRDGKWVDWWEGLFGKYEYGVRESYSE